MKVGILTFHRAHNYGAVLQCYALQETLKKLNQEVAIIDYRQPRTEWTYKILSIKPILENKLRLRKSLRYIKSWRARAAKKKIFESFIATFLNITPKCNRKNIPQDFDRYIIGSDQVWGINCLGGKEDLVYMGEFEHPTKSQITSYAISSNINSLQTIGNKKLSKYISNFAQISFRENKIAQYLKQELNTNIHVDIDPTLLLDKKEWEQITTNKWNGKKYLLLYQIRTKKGNPLRKKALEIAQNNNWEFIDASNMQYSVEDFVSLVKYAQCVVTSSFHASVFALIFEKRFFSVILNDGYDERYVNLLNNVGASEALVDINCSTNLFPNLNFESIKNKIEIIRQNSIRYIKESILNEGNNTPE